MTMIVDRKSIIFGNHDQKTLQQFHDVVSRAERGALMADGHVGYVMPIGGVAAYDNQVSPVGVGFDIGCGNLAVKLDAQSKDLHIPKVLDLVQQHIEFGVGQTNADAPRDHEFFDDPAWEAYEIVNVKNKLKELAKSQLGTVGSGNHYVDIFEDEAGNTWIGVHFGSRGLGHKTASGFMNISQGKAWESHAQEKEVLLDLDNQLGKAYFTAMQLAGKYAYIGREWVCETLAKKLGAKIVDRVHNHHNFAWKENHNGRDYIVVRKGATPAFPGQRGFVGGSMGDDAVIVEGRENSESKNALYSTIHGAGRIMSRAQAAGKYRGWGKRRKKIAEGQISRTMLVDWLNRKNVELRGGGLDEAPQAYRRLNEVVLLQGSTIRVVHTLRPLGVVMAGEEEFDPYKD